MYRYFYKITNRILGNGLYNSYSDQGEPPNPPPPKERITEAGITRITEDGQIRITEN